MGIRTKKPQEIADTFVARFQGLLNNYEGSNREAQAKMLKFIPKLIWPEDNKELNKPITLDEVRSVVFNMNPEKSLGPDGFQAFFLSEMLGYCGGGFMESHWSIKEWMFFAGWN